MQIWYADKYVKSSIPEFNIKSEIVTISNPIQKSRNKIVVKIEIKTTWREEA